MFIGEYSHSLDAKGRLIIPAKFRDGLGEHFIVTKGIDRCLYIYPRSEWEVFEEKLRQLPLANTDARRFTRFFLSGAVECDVDNQGRIIIPQSLRSYASLGKEVVSAGVGSRIEVWNKENWDTECDPDRIDDSIIESMGLFGI
ncbi:transcriptional regulator MraZ [Clostridiales bacterium]|nr:transcriptional regulator MraZ [Clostridiales bacterium]